jgi:D-alanine transaminase
VPNIVFLNGQYLPVEEATVSVMDRGFLFGDGVYEVVPVFGKKLLRLGDHLQRLQNSLDRISCLNPHADAEWEAIFSDLLGKNPGEDRAVYLQISRGAYVKRDLTANAENPPTIFAMVLHVTPPDIDVVSAGISVITVDDFRWNACDIKSTSLVANVMLRQQATDASVDDAILVKNGAVTEGPGITRDLVIEIAKNNTILIEVRDIRESELYSADEIWMTSSTREIAPVVKLNGEEVGSGVAGDMWKCMMNLYQQYKQELRRE